jgi:hypothetical protein
MKKLRRVLIIPFMGGLGNQLFQYAAGIHVRKFTTKHTYFSQSGLLNTKNTPRSYMLGDLLKSSDVKNRGRFTLAVFKLSSFVVPSIWVSERDLSDFPLERVSKTTKVLLGYFQRINYVDSVAAELVQAMRHSSQFRILATTLSTNDLAVHIRFGDYLSSPETKMFHGLTAMSYYVNAVNHLLSIGSFERVVIYSDDPSKAYSDFTQAFGSREIPVVPSAHLGEIEELASMSSSKGLVISNSTFSWWAAWIGTQLHDCNVVAPRPWFAMPSAAEDNLLPNRWTVLDRELQP